MGLESEIRTVIMGMGEVRSKRSAIISVTQSRPIELHASSPLRNLTRQATIKKAPWPLVRKLTISTERPPLIGEI
jgi:hypothetical protein